MPPRLAHLLRLTVCLTFAATNADDGLVRFNRDVRPILSDRCFACHGPDAGHREADLRLDQPHTPDADGRVIVAGDPDASELISRITAADESLRMPPAESGKPLTTAEVNTLRQWIREGAEYEGHWAFLPLSKAAPPELGAADPPQPQPRNGIDRFVQRALQRRSLSQSPEADRATLIRRLSLDLVGLLPEPEEVTQFLNDDRDDAYERLVNRLLASPHYGERWGRHWLDQARYADSHGYTIDGERVMWPYRDWVIHALNEDMPFDQFTIEQLAGDLLPDATLAQRVATGFHRNTLINQEGGTDPEQFRVEATIDRTNTTGAVWLGLTLGCAQCHTHKFDPISQREYYQFYAFFNHCVDVNNVGPTVEVHQGELFLDEVDPTLLEELQAATAAVKQLEAGKQQRQAVWEASLQQNASDRRAPQQLSWTVLQPDTVTAEQAAFQILNDGSVLATQGVLREIYRFESVTLPADAMLGSLQLEVLPDPSLPKNGPGLAGNGNFVLTSVDVFLGDEPLALNAASSTHSQSGYPSSALIDGDPGTGWAINVSGKSSVTMNSRHTAWLALERAVAAGGRPLRIVMKHELNNNYNVGRFRFSYSSDVPDASADPALLAALQTPRAQRTREQSRDLSTAFAAVDSEYRSARTRVDNLRRRIGLGAAARTMVLQELQNPRPTWLLTRGDFLRPDKHAGQIQPGVLACLPPLPPVDDGERYTRLDLARWLVADTNPITPRVFVNRVWMRYFGRGLVETENDFGSQGSLPTHPELLDWLARQLIEQNWSQKSLHRLIVTSHTYRQSSRARDDLKQLDPLNLLLARQNRLRLDAEIVRDVALSASGALNPAIGGPGVFPPQPDGVYSFTQNRKNWRTNDNEDRFRRGMYTMFYRSAPYPALTTFDAPDFQSVCTRRARSNTPLQALTMANDTTMFELARELATRVISEADNDATRLDRLYMICFSRMPSAKESMVLQDYLAQQRQSFIDRPATLAAVTGESAGDSDLGAWIAVSRVVMNTDEFITRE
jgi:hypothetical protein